MAAKNGECDGAWADWPAVLVGLCLLLGCSAALAQGTHGITVGLHTVTAHDHRARPDGGDYETATPGLYAHDGATGLTAGLLRNSYGRRSVYAGWSVSSPRWHGLSAGLTIGAIRVQTERRDTAGSGTQDGTALSAQPQAVAIATPVTSAPGAGAAPRMRIGTTSGTASASAASTSSGTAGSAADMGSAQLGVRWLPLLVPSVAVDLTSDITLRVLSLPKLTRAQTASAVSISLEWTY